MLAYAAHRPVVGKAQSSPNALLVVVAAHVAVIAAVMSAKMDLPQRILRDPPIIVETFREPPPPPPQSVVEPRTAPISKWTTPPKADVPLPPIENPQVDAGPVAEPGAIAGGGASVIPIIPSPIVTPVHHGPKLLTPAADLRPPYPASKLLSEEEAVLHLKLSIDEHGRVVGVEPVGPADREFVEAARRHLLARWRYAPATQDGRAVSSSATVTLRFLLDG